MKVRFGAAPIGSKFVGFLTGTVFMKIGGVIKEEHIFERKPVLWKRNVVVIEGPNTGRLGLLSEDDEYELVS